MKYQKGLNNMTQKEFNLVLKDTLEKITNLLANKSKEYDFGGDRLHSFKTAAKLQGTTQVDSLMGYLTKHIVSVYDMVKVYDNFPIEKWDEKIIDCINYLILLRAVLIEESDTTVRELLSKPSISEELAGKGIILQKSGDGTDE